MNNIFIKCCGLIMDMIDHCVFHQTYFKEDNKTFGHVIGFKAVTFNV